MTSPLIPLLFFDWLRMKEREIGRGFNGLKIGFIATR